MTTVFGDYQDNAPGSAHSNSTAHSGPPPTAPAGNGTGTGATLKTTVQWPPSGSHGETTPKHNNKTDTRQRQQLPLLQNTGTTLHLTNKQLNKRVWRDTGCLSPHKSKQHKRHPCIRWSLRVPWNCLGLINATQPRSRPDPRLWPSPAGPTDLPGTLLPRPPHTALGGCRRCATRGSLSP